MSLAVEQTLPRREVLVGHGENERDAAESFITSAAPNVASGRAGRQSLSITTSNPFTKPKRSTYHFQRHYQVAMDGREITSPTSEQHHVEEAMPELPQKSNLRASRMLMGLKISPSAEPIEFTHTPHEEYLSSEEDASSTSGDFSDFEYDSSSDDGPSPAEDCTEHVEARVVSVIYSGKPSVVDVPQPRRSISPASIERPLSMSGLSDKAFKISALKNRRTSVSTTMSAQYTSMSLHPPRPIPPRSISLQPPSEALKSRLDFLRIDPYANGSSYSLSPSPVEPLEPRTVRPMEETERPKTPTPKSPTKSSMFRGVARAMSLMKKRSTPKMGEGYLAPDSIAEHPYRPHSPLSAVEASADFPRMNEVAQQHARRPASEVLTAPPTPVGPPPRPLLQPSLTQDEVIRVAKRNIQHTKQLNSTRSFPVAEFVDSPISPMSPLSFAPLPKESPSTPTKRLSTFGFGRRRMSMKVTGGKS